MYHDKIIQLENGDKVKINVSFYLNHYTPVYGITLYICKKGKRKFDELKFESYDYRSLSMEARKEYRDKKHLEFISAAQILEAKNELWQKLSPSASEGNGA